LISDLDVVGARHRCSQLRCCDLLLFSKRLPILWIVQFEQTQSFL